MAFVSKNVCETPMLKQYWRNATADPKHSVPEVTNQPYKLLIVWLCNPINYWSLCDADSFEFTGNLSNNNHCKATDHIFPISKVLFLLSTDLLFHFFLTDEWTSTSKSLALRHNISGSKGMIISFPCRNNNIDWTAEWSGQKKEKKAQNKLKIKSFEASKDTWQIKRFH